MITIENRKGIIYERIDGKTLLNIMMENETNLDEYLNIFVNLYTYLIHVYALQSKADTLKSKLIKTIFY